MSLRPLEHSSQENWRARSPSRAKQIIGRSLLFPSLRRQLVVPGGNCATRLWPPDNAIRDASSDLPKPKRDRAKPMDEQMTHWQHWRGKEQAWRQTSQRQAMT
jgi:hypothetical protein